MRYRYATLLVLLVCALSSCRLVRVHFGVAQAVNDYAHGEYQDANRRLIELRDAPGFEPWISYNLGTVYYALGEPAAAAEAWEETGFASARDLAFRVEFNMGVIEYERGAYDAAYERFRHALELDPSSVEAKVNLELAFERMERRGPSGGENVEQPDRPAEPEDEPGPEVRRLLQYVERLERDAWSSTERIEPAEATGEVPDW